jgi:hypothetical protein
LTLPQSAVCFVLGGAVALGLAYFLSEDCSRRAPRRDAVIIFGAQFFDLGPNPRFRSRAHVFQLLAVALRSLSAEPCLYFCLTARFFLRLTARASSA